MSTACIRISFRTIAGTFITRDICMLYVVHAVALLGCSFVLFLLRLDARTWVFSQFLELLATSGPSFHFNNIIKFYRSQCARNFIENKSFPARKFRAQKRSTEYLSRWVSYSHMDKLRKVRKFSYTCRHSTLCGIRFGLMYHGFAWTCQLIHKFGTKYARTLTTDHLVSNTRSELRLSTISKVIQYFSAL